MVSLFQNFPEIEKPSHSLPAAHSLVFHENPPHGELKPGFDLQVMRIAKQLKTQMEKNSSEVNRTPQACFFSLSRMDYLSLRRISFFFYYIWFPIDGYLWFSVFVFGRQKSVREGSRKRLFPAHQAAFPDINRGRTPEALDPAPP